MLKQGAFPKRRKNSLQEAVKTCHVIEMQGSTQKQNEYSSTVNIPSRRYQMAPANATTKSQKMVGSQHINIEPGCRKNENSKLTELRVKSVKSINSIKNIEGSSKNDDISIQEIQVQEPRAPNKKSKKVGFKNTQPHSQKKILTKNGQKQAHTEKNIKSAKSIKFKEEKDVFTYSESSRIRRKRPKEVQDHECCQLI